MFLNIRAPKLASCTAGDQKRRNSDFRIHRKQSPCPSKAPAFEIHARRTKNRVRGSRFSQRSGITGGSPICVQISRVASYCTHTVTCRERISLPPFACRDKGNKEVLVAHPNPSSFFILPFCTRSAVLNHQPDGRVPALLLLPFFRARRV